MERLFGRAIAIRQAYQLTLAGLGYFQRLKLAENLPMFLLLQCMRDLNRIRLGCNWSEALAAKDPTPMLCP
jgi:hypothetical protein